MSNHLSENSIKKRQPFAHTSVAVAFALLPIAYEVALYKLMPEPTYEKPHLRLLRVLVAFPIVSLGTFMLNMNLKRVWLCWQNVVFLVLVLLLTAFHCLGVWLIRQLALMQESM